MHDIFLLLTDIASRFGYTGIIFLMTIESSAIPFPSELVIPPAAYLASKGILNIYLVIISGIVGSIIGALINYYIAATLGRRVIYRLSESKYAKFLLLNQHKIQTAENYFIKYGNISTFTGRLIFVVRQLISIPAGFSKINLRDFILYTTLGSGIWVTILAILGYILGAKQELMLKYFKQISYASLSLILIVGGTIYWIRKNRHL